MIMLVWQLSHQCAGHTLQFVVNHAIKKGPQISKALAAATCLIEHFRKRQLASSMFKNKFVTPEHRLIQDVHEEME